MAMARQARLEILNRAILAEEIRHLLSRFDNSQRKAEKGTGIGASQLSRMLNQKFGEVTVPQFHQLSAAIAPERTEAFLHAFFPANMVTCYTAYLEWVTTETERLRAGPADSWMLLFDGPTLASTVGAHPHETHQIELHLVINHWRERHPSSYNDFIAKMAKLSVSPERQELAIVRVVVPLLDALASAFVERAWQHLEESEFFSFVEAGAKRELILLNRSADLQRFQDLGPWVVVGKSSDSPTGEEPSHAGP